MESTIQNTALQTRYRSMTTASTDLYRYNIQLSPLMAAEKSSETNWRTRRVTGNDDDDYLQYTSAKVQIDYRLRYAHSRTRAAHSKLPVDPCATRSL